jgi:hypothetical protein
MYTGSAHFGAFLIKRPMRCFFLVKMTLHHGAHLIEKWCAPVYGAGVFFSTPLSKPWFFSVKFV